MTVKELIEVLKLFPEDREVVMNAKKGYIDYTEGDAWFGFGTVNKVCEITSACDRKLIGKIKFEYLTEEEMSQELRWREYDKDDTRPMHFYYKPSDGEGIEIKKNLNR